MLVVMPASVSEEGKGLHPHPNVPRTLPLLVHGSCTLQLQQRVGGKELGISVPGGLSAWLHLHVSQRDADAACPDAVLCYDRMMQRCNVSLPGCAHSFSLDWWDLPLFLP